MALSETFTGLASEADCLFLCQNISGTGESESELGQHSLTNSTQRKVFQLVVSWLWHVLDWRLMSCPLVLPKTCQVICFRGRSLDTIDIYSRQWMPQGNGRQGMASGLQPTSAKAYISLHHGLGLRDPPWWGLETHFCQWRSPRNSLGCGGIRSSHLRSTSVCWRHSARRLSASSEWSLTWNGEGTETLLMLYRAIVGSKLDYGCIVYGTASNTNLRQLDSIQNYGLRLALGAFCTSPVSSL